MRGADTTFAEQGFVTEGGTTINERILVLPDGQTGTFKTTGDVTGLNGAELVIESGAVFDHQNNGDFDVGGASTTPPRLINRGTYQFTAGQTSGNANLNWELENPGLLELTGGETYDVNDRIFDADGTADQTGGTYRVGSTSTLRLRTDDPTTFASDSRLAAVSGAQLDLGSGVSSNTAIDVAGEVDVAGTFDTGDGNTTTITVESGATLQELGGDALRVDDSAELIVQTGEAGTPDSVSVGELVVRDNSTFRPSTVVEVVGQTDVSFGGLFESSEALVSRGMLQWNGGTMRGADTTFAKQGLLTEGGSTLDGRTLVLADGETGTYKTNNNITGANGARLVIESGAVFDHQNNGNFEVGGGTPPRLINRGTYQLTAGATAGEANLYWELQNSGVLEVTGGETYNVNDQIFNADGTAGRTEGAYRSGNGPLKLNIGSDTLRLEANALIAPQSGGEVQVSAPLVGSGAFEVGGTLDAQSPIFVDGGQMMLQGGQIVRGTSTDTALVQRRGEFEGAGSVTGVVVAEDGTVEPGGDGAAGSMTVNGVYEQTSSARLIAELGGTTAGTQYDVLTATEATLAGELRLEQLNDFNPTTADTLRPVDWGGGGRTGQFDQISGRSTFDSPLKVQYDDAGDRALEVAGKILPGRDVEPTSLSDTLVFSKARTQSLIIENTETDSDAENLEAMIQAQDNPSWLSLSPTSVSIPPGGTATVDVQLSAQRTAPGTYRDTIEITDPELDGALPVPVQFTIERPNITLSPSPQVASPGAKVDIEVGIPQTFTPKSGSLAYRPAGDEAFQFASLDANVSGLADNTSHTVTTSVPASAVTKRGVQYYVRLTSQDSTGTVPINTPAGVPSRSAFVPVEFQEIQAEGAFPEEGYRMLTVPVAGLGDRSVFDLLKAQYGPYDPAQWRFARWAPSQSAYREGADVGPLQPGEAAWFVLEEGTPLTITGGGRSVEASSPRPIPLKPGWNQVGNPFPFPVAWSSVAVPTPVRPPVGYDPTRPAGERFRFGIDVLPAWSGAFVYNSADTSVTLTVPPEGATTASAAMKGRALTHTTSSDGTYRLRAIAHVSNGGRQQWSRPVQLGFAAEAEEGLGTKDRVQPPAIRSQMRLQTGPSKGPALARSVKPVPATDESAAKQGGVWDLTLHLGKDVQTAETAALQLNAKGSRPDSFRRYVVDRDENRRLPMTHETATVSLSEGRSTRRLRVIVGTKAFAKAHSEGATMAVQKTTLRANAPNPFSESTTIPYQVAEETHVRIAVYDLLGRRVSVLVDGTREAGIHQFQWRPGERGTALASGTYFCRMRAAGETFTQKLVVVR